MRGVTQILCAAACLVALVGPARSAPREFSCEGTTIIDVNGYIGAQTPFDSVFSLNGDEVTMVEGDDMRFAKSYTRSAELESKDASRQAFTSERGNLFLYRESDRFEIFWVSVVDGRIRIERTEGRCKAFVRQRLFD